ncbi:MAG: NAD(+)/NADH kinase [Peptococcaceae bacterium]|nr:NAD(+)/NADH kinase [Peptococcaceae bacterium]
MAPRKIGIMANLGKAGLEDLIKNVCNCLVDNNIEILAQTSLKDKIGNIIQEVPLEKMLEEIECLLVFGGDGTILNSGRHAAASGVPLLGINLGRLGFLSEVDVPNIQLGLESIISKDYHIEERMMIEAAVVREGREIARHIALNDAVITKGAFARLIYLELRVSGEPVGTYPADGLIVSTPTGSTAYSLSAGGPVVTPDLDLMLITPICTHALWARPIVVSPSSIIEIELVASMEEVMLTMDGQQGLQLKKHDRVIITQAPYKVKFIKLESRNFFRVLKQKMREGDMRQC